MNVAIHHPRSIIAIGVAVALALLALLPGTWGTALAQTAGTPTATITIVNPGAQSTATVVGTATATVGNSNNDGGASVSVPAGSMPSGSTVTVTSPPAFAGFVRVGTGANKGIVTVPVVMNLEATDGDGNEVTSFTEPVTVRVNVPDSLWAQVLRLSGTANPVVKVQNINPSTGVTTTIECTLVDSATGVVDCALPHFSEWSMEIEFDTAPGVDVVEEFGGSGVVPSPADTGMGVTEESGATNPLAIALGVLALAGIAGAGARFAIGRRSA
ncbi:MAG: hypothetical protein KC458_02015 [Dehalococcoidia bacterium]|nr:hypothetical protein [Dehalococcoidia bacterium]MCA9856034.1 hypothetical protein [Dehalococcoidia bacterium]